MTSSRATFTSTVSVAQSRLDFIDGLRGLAILLVLLRHYYMGVYTPSLPRWADTLGLGYLGVHLFLLLSGFCIAWPYVGEGGRRLDLRDFWFRRASRILPAYYVTLGISFWLALPLSAGDFFWQAITHLTMTHNFFITTVTALNGPFWSLALELQLYILFPVLLLYSRRFGVLPVILIVGAIQLAFRSFVAWKFGTAYNDLTFVLPWSVIGRMLEFTLGMWAASVVRQGNTASNTTTWQRAAPLAIPLLVIAAMVAKRIFGTTAPLTDLVWSLTFLSLLFGASIPNSYLNKLLSCVPIVWLGTISYSVYLMHEIFLRYMTTFIRNTILQPYAVLAILPIVLAITICCCAVFYYAIEKPVQVYFTARRSKLSSAVEHQRLAKKPLMGR